MTINPDEPTGLTLGETIRTNRVARGWSQEDVARAVGTTQSRVSQWELDEVRPQPSKLRKIASTFGLEYSKLLTSAAMNREDVLGIPRRLISLWSDVAEFDDPEIADAVLDVLRAVVGLLKVVYDRLYPRR